MDIDPTSSSTMTTTPSLPPHPPNLNSDSDPNSPSTSPRVPPELLSRILSFSSDTSLISHAPVSRLFTHVTGKRIYTNLDFSHLPHTWPEEEEWVVKEMEKQLFGYLRILKIGRHKQRGNEDGVSHLLGYIKGVKTVHLDIRPFQAEAGGGGGGGGMRFMEFCSAFGRDNPCPVLKCLEKPKNLVISGTADPTVDFPSENRELIQHLKVEKTIFILSPGGSTNIRRSSSLHYWLPEDCLDVVFIFGFFPIPPIGYDPNRPPAPPRWDNTFPTMEHAIRPFSRVISTHFEKRYTFVFNSWSLPDTWFKQAQEGEGEVGNEERKRTVEFATVLADKVRERLEMKGWTEEEVRQGLVMRFLTPKEWLEEWRKDKGEAGWREVLSEKEAKRAFGESVLAGY